MSSDSGGESWQPASSGSRSSRPTASMHCLVPSQAMGPPAYNTRSAAYATSNFAQRIQSENRYVLPLEQQARDGSLPSTSNRSQSQSSRSSQSEQELNRTTQNYQMDNEVYPNYQVPSLGSVSSIKVSDASESQYSENKQELHNAVMFTPNGEYNNGPSIPMLRDSNRSTNSATMGDIEIGSILDSPKYLSQKDQVNTNAQIFYAFDKLQQQILNLTKATANTNKNISDLNKDIVDIKLSAQCSSPTLFGQQAPMPQQELHRVNKKVDQSNHCDESGLSYGTEKESEEKIVSKASIQKPHEMRTFSPGSLYNDMTKSKQMSKFTYGGHNKVTDTVNHNMIPKDKSSTFDRTTHSAFRVPYNEYDKKDHISFNHGNSGKHEIHTAVPFLNEFNIHFKLGLNGNSISHTFLFMLNIHANILLLLLSLLGWKISLAICLAFQSMIPFFDRVFQEFSGWSMIPIVMISVSTVGWLRRADSF